MNQSAWKLAAVILLLAITVLSLIPAEPKAGVSVVDKVQHLIAYGALTFSLLRAFSASSVWRVVVAAVLFGVVIEFAQEWLTTTRQLDPLDMVANMLGVMLAVLLSTYYCRFCREGTAINSDKKSVNRGARESDREPSNPI